VEGFDAQTRNFGELLGQYENRRVIIPRFQRGYSWEKDHVAAFWDDIRSFRQQPGTEKYFLGPIVTTGRAAISY
jgi:uncharacterized protein with ParB-like and HNH nuclease domain